MKKAWLLIEYDHVDNEDYSKERVIGISLSERKSISWRQEETHLSSNPKQIFADRRIEEIEILYEEEC